MKIKKVIILLSMMVVFLGIVIYNITLNQDAPIKYDKNIIISNKDSYTIVAKVCYEDYKKFGDNVERLTYSPWIENDFNGDIQRVYCLSNDRHFDINEQQAKAFDIVVNTYKLDNNKIDRIYVEENFVIFGNERGQTALIYSINDSKPSWINGSHDNEKAYVEIICDNWYYACRKSVFLN